MQNKYDIKSTIFSDSKIEAFKYMTSTEILYVGFLLVISPTYEYLSLDTNSSQNTR
jgi:hypothetical protein